MGKIREFLTGELDDKQSLAVVTHVPDASDLGMEHEPLLPLTDEEKPLYVQMVKDAVKQAFED